MMLHRRGPRSIAGALSPLRDGWAPETVLAEVQRVWTAAVGAAIAAEARPVSERAGVLTVACESAAWAHELDLMAPSLLDRVNEQLARGRITRLRCVSGGSQQARF
jgi:predicted nucleic acid-binding Zn ribbon protein